MELFLNEGKEIRGEHTYYQIPKSRNSRFTTVTSTIVTPCPSFYSGKEVTWGIGKIKVFGVRQIKGSSPASSFTSESTGIYQVGGSI